MKKNYKSPKVQKLVFDYTNTVTASDTPIGPSETSKLIREKYYTSPQAGSPPPCSFQWRYVSEC